MRNIIGGLTASTLLTLIDRLRQLDIDNPLLGLRAFVWNVEQSI